MFPFQATGALCLVVLLTAVGPSLAVAQTNGPFRLVADKCELRSWSDPGHVTVECAGRLFFARHDRRGCELWVTDGSAGGTRCVKDICPGPESSHPSHMAVFKNQVFFLANDARDRGLYKSDGTEDGTVYLHRVNSFKGTVLFAHCNGYLYFADGGLLCRTDGTPEGTEELWDTRGAAYGMMPVGKRLVYFTEKGMFAVDEDGKDRFLKPIWYEEGAGLTNQHCATLNGELYFAARCWEPRTGVELWKTDGTEAGTRLVKDLNWGPGSSFPSWFCVWNGKIFFSADANIDEPVGVELCCTDGTEEGTQVVADIYPGGERPPHGSEPRWLMATERGVLFFANTPHQTGRVILTDGTRTGTQVLSMAFSDGVTLIPVQGGAVFSGTTVASGRPRALWYTDGTSGNTKELVRPPKGWITEDARNIHLLPNALLFFAMKVAPTDELWAWPLR